MLTQVYIHLGVAFAGLVSFLSPCVLPLVPPYLGYLGGTTIDQMGNKDEIDPRLWRRVVLASVFFVLGFTTVFVGFGAGASVFGQWIQAHKNQLGVVAGLVIIVFGLHFLGVLRVPLLYREVRIHTDRQGASFAGAYVMGLAFAFGWTPCIGPVLATVLTLAANEASLGAGVRLLFVYSLELGIPFILAAVAIGPFLGFPQALPATPRPRRDGDGPAPDFDRCLDPHGRAQLVWHLDDRKRAGTGADRGVLHAEAIAD